MIHEAPCALKGPVLPEICSNYPFITRILDRALSRGGDFAEIFFEHTHSGSLFMEEGLLKESSASVRIGAGIRVLRYPRCGYSYTNRLTSEALLEAAAIAAEISSSKKRNSAEEPHRMNRTVQCYDLSQNPFNRDLPSLTELVQEGHDAALGEDSNIVTVQAVLGYSIQSLCIVNSEGLLVSDLRPLIKYSVHATAEKDGERQNGLDVVSARAGLGLFQGENTPEKIGKRAAREAVILLDGAEPPAGDQPVVLSAKHSGVVIHEAVGHPLEADSHWKEMSILSGRVGERIASPLVTIYDQGDLRQARGSLNIDDEGTETSNTILIEKGKLCGLLHDRISAHMLGAALTGNGRRSSFRAPPLPRMTNTRLAAGESDPEEIIRSVKRGFYAESYQGGQVEDSGRFTFSVNLGYLIENGRLTRPVKNATLIGHNLTALKNISMVGNDSGIFSGNCGKEGQTVPVTAGTPTFKIDSITVGGR